MLEKVVFLGTVIGAIIFFSIPALAAPSGGTDPVIKDRVWAMGIEVDQVFDRKLKASDINDGKIGFSTTGYAKVIFKPSKYLSFYGKGGLSKFDLEMELPTGKTLKEDYRPGLFTGAGTRLLLELGPKFQLAIDGQFNYWNNDIEALTYGGIGATTVSGDTTAWEYQVSGILSYKIDWNKVIHPIHGEFPILIPYAGIKYAHLDIDCNFTADSAGNYSFSALDSRENDSKLGVIIGTDLDMLSMGGFNFNIEARIIDETAVTVGGTYNF